MNDSCAFGEFTRQDAKIARQHEEILRLRTALFEQRTELLERIAELRKEQRADFRFLAGFLMFVMFWPAILHMI
jgi:predicted transcriptional regulator